MADTSQRLAGVAYLSVDGQSYQLSGDFEYSVSRVTRETLAGQDTIHGYKEMPTAPYIAATLRDSKAVSVLAINNMTNSTIVVELANGKTIVGRNMWTVNVQSVKSTDATLEVRWEGIDVTEQ